MRKARSVSGAVSADVGSATIDACEFGCTVAADCDSPPCTPTPGGGEELVAVEAAPTATVGVRRLLRRNAVLRRTPMSESGGGTLGSNRSFFYFLFFILRVCCVFERADRG